jgi:two-component system phosphate regulon sensor histidine kinase PhoR
VAHPETFVERLFYLYDHLEETAVDEIEVLLPSRRILERYSGPVYREEGQLLGRIEVYSDTTEVRELHRNKDEFLSLVSHELRTPVTSIKGYAQLLQRRARREHLPAQTASAYATIERQAARMQELIDLLLDLSRLEAGRLKIQAAPVNLTDLIKRVVEMVQSTADLHRIDMRLPREPVSIQGDERRLEQVLMNVLTNAVRYSPDGGTVTLSLECQSDRVRISVADTGVGIAPDSLARVFERFYRAASTPLPTGMGIGLYITRGIVEEHGGKIGVESELGKGSTFTVELPANTSRGAQRSPAGATEQ